MPAMLLASHALIGAAAARLAPDRRRAALLGAASHAVADGVAHDDTALGAVAQGALGLLALGAVARRHGLDSRELAGALGGAAPDAEIAVWILRGRPRSRLLFPSHWQRVPGKHPYTYPGLRLPIAAELAMVAALAAVVLARPPSAATSTGSSTEGRPAVPEQPAAPAAAAA